MRKGIEHRDITATPIVCASLPREVELEARADAALTNSQANEALSGRVTT